MAEFNINCPHCGAELEANEEWIGMELECPACNKNFVVKKETPVEKASVPTLHLPKLTPQEDKTDLPTLAPLAATSNTQEAEATEENSFMFVCPACGTQVELPVILKGKKYECKACAEESIAEATTEKRCPFCGKMIKIHATVCKHCKKDVTNAPINMPPPKEETFPYFCPECDTFVELPVSMNGKKYKCKSCCEMSIAKPATERKCPACGEMIKIKATICKHCRQSVPPLMGSNAINLQPIQPIQSNGSNLVGSLLSKGRNTISHSPESTSANVTVGMPQLTPITSANICNGNADQNEGDVFTLMADEQLILIANGCKTNWAPSTTYLTTKRIVVCKKMSKIFYILSLLCPLITIWLLWGPVVAFIVVGIPIYIIEFVFNGNKMTYNIPRESITNIVNGFGFSQKITTSDYGELRICYNWGWKSRNRVMQWWQNGI